MKNAKNLFLNYIHTPLARYLSIAIKYHCYDSCYMENVSEAALTACKYQLARFTVPSARIHLETLV